MEDRQAKRQAKESGKVVRADSSLIYGVFIKKLKISKRFP